MLKLFMLATRDRQWLAAVFLFLLLLATTACSSGKGTATTADAKSDNGLALNIDGKVNSDGKADDATSDADGTDLDGLAFDTSGQSDLPGYDVLANCPGGALCPCKANTDCQSGLCLEDLSVDGGKACAQPCKPTCGPGYVCANLTGNGSDIQQVCVYQAARLCDPCSASKDCEVVGLADSKCIDQGVLGRFCGVACSEDGDCPGDYACQQVAAVDGGKFKQCVRAATKGSAAAFGECACTAAAVKKQLATQCIAEFVGGEGKLSGKCKGVRTCGSTGLSACNAPAPATETCDGADNDCDGETDEATCNDQLPCTNDVCDGKGSCVYSFVSGPSCDLAKGCTQVSDNGKPCEADNSLCTQGDLCSNGVCVVGTAVQCDDGNPCTVDGCDKKTGLCTASAVDDGVPCNDGTKCTEKDACKAGVCKGKGVGCDDDNACTEDVCDPQLGCQISKLSGAPCSDDNPCSVGDLCADGQCKGGTPKECSSADPCVTSKCSPVDGKCKLGEAAAGTKCDDGNGCTTGETCGGGVCQGGANNCGCQNDQDCAAQEDGSLCNGTLYCDKGKLPFVCKVKAVSVVKCDTSGDGECSTTTCAPATGACEKVAAADGKGCDADGSVCTVADACADGKCSAGKAKNCDDGNVCTDDGCDAVVGCKKAGNSKPCDDGNACTGADGCSGGTCSGVPKNPVSDCGDGSPCTNDACDPKAGCTHTANQAQCDDGNPCTVGDLCGGGQCAAGQNTCGCQSDKDCTAQEDGDLCNGTLFCSKVKLPFVCAVDVKTIVTCDTSKDTACSASVCNGKSGACGKVLAPDGKGCDADASVCTGGDACKAGLCAAGAIVPCNDKNPCTTDSCDPKTGCVQQANLASCDADGDACTVGDTCQAKVCMTGVKKLCEDGEVCTANSCNPTTGACVFNAGSEAGKPCDADGSVCTVGDACKSGSCVAGGVKICDDQNPCTDDACDKQKGCVFAPNTQPCDDGNACTANDLCAASLCAGKSLNPQVDCSDGQVCTTDGCDPKVGCTHSANQQQCDDGNPCTNGDTCATTVCQSGSNVCGCQKDADCSGQEDGDLCNGTLFCDTAKLPYTCKVKASTVVVCDSGKDSTCATNTCAGQSGKCGLVSAQDGKACDADASVCTLEDKCLAGLCKAGAAVSCNDKNPCTDDSCDAKSGCAHAVNTASCTDNNLCTANDFCLDGACTPGQNIPCDDKKPCTTDSCLPLKGCAFSNAVDGSQCGQNGICLAGNCKLPVLANVVATGYGHSCAAATDGAVWCWGVGYALGNGSGDSVNSPKEVKKFTDGVKHLAAGHGHTCAIDGTGGVWCWGSNDSGQLGDGTKSNGHIPLQTGSQYGKAKGIAAGGVHTCAIGLDSDVWCWGSNNAGQLGDGTQIDRLLPTKAVGLTATVAQISAGEKHTCVVLGAGEVFCWGKNDYGQLGNGTKTDSFKPVKVIGLQSPAKLVATGDKHTCIVDSGGIKCWGGNYHGQLGNGTLLATAIPVAVGGIMGSVKSIAAGASHTCVVDSLNAAQCWGKNYYGELGINAYGEKTSATQVAGLGTDVQGISAGMNHSCAVLVGGKVVCWGNGYYGQLGDGVTRGKKTAAVQVVGLTDGALSVGAGYNHSCAISKGGAVKCWGMNESRQLGDGSTDNAAQEPRQVVGLTQGVTFISVGEHHTCAIDAAGVAKCWGYNGLGALGNGTNETPVAPVKVLGLVSGLKSLTAGKDHTCAVDNSGSAYCWGQNSFGELGDGTTAGKNIPVKVFGLSPADPVVSIAASSGHSCALLAGGSVKCWGANYYGQIGDGTKVGKLTPVTATVVGKAAVAIAVTNTSSCALLNDNTVKCWGGQGGVATPTGLVKSIVAKFDNICAVSLEDKTDCFPGAVLALASGYSHFCAIVGGGAVNCVGWNNAGQLGDSSAWASAPVAVLGFGSL